MEAKWLVFAYSLIDMILKLSCIVSWLMRFVKQALQAAPRTIGTLQCFIFIFVIITIQVTLFDAPTEAAKHFAYLCSVQMTVRK